MRILIVDDHTLFRDGLALLLKGLATEIQIASAATCSEAFKVLEQNSAVDLILMDLGLPEVSGTDAIQMIRREYPEIPIVVLSGTNDSATVRRTIQEGAMGFIPKTHSADLLLGALHFILVHKGIYLPPDVLLEPADTSNERSAQPVSRTATPADLGLTQRQTDVLYQLLQGKSNKAIAKTLGIEEPTVKAHVNAVLRALKVTTRTGAVIAANRMKLVFATDP